MQIAQKKYRIIYILTIILGFITAFFMSRFSLCLGKVIDVVLNPTDTLVRTILTCIIMMVCWLVTSFLYDYSEIIYVNKIICFIKKRLYSSLYGKEINEFNKEKNGEYLSLYSKDIDLLIDNYLLPKCDIICNLLSAVVCLASIFMINWKLGISFVIISLFTIVLSQLPGIIMSKATNEYTATNSSYMALLENYLKGFEQVKLLGLEDLFKNKLSIKDNDYEKSRKNYLFAKISVNDLGMCFGMLSQLFCMAIGIWFVLHGSMTVGLLIAAVQLLNGVFSPIQNFVQDKNLMGTTTEIIERINKNCEVKEKNEKEFSDTIDTIDFKDINLKFGEKQILEDYNLKFEKGKKYAIVGESGKGKSSLLKLMMKYFSTKDYEGNILINGQNISNISSSSLYDKIGYVQRNEFMIDGTVKDNILLYRKENNTNNVNEICDKLNINNALAEKNIAMANSAEVSFGEKQRIDIARFLVHDYDVIAFDEPTSNLDEKTSNEIFNTILGIQNKIVIVITHNIREDLLNRFDAVIQM